MGLRYQTSDLQNPTDLENMVTQMVTEAKIDACIQYYFKGVAELDREVKRIIEAEPDQWWFSRVFLVTLCPEKIPSQIAYLRNPDEHFQKYSRILNDLKNNLDRFVPGYTENGGSDIFSNEKLKERLQSRADLAYQEFSV
jgi:hypothetical protein